MAKRPFVAEQPKDGETVLHCGHMHERWDGVARDRWHWFRFDPPTIFTRPDGTTGTTRWLTACDQCYRRHGEKVPVRGDGIWRGDEPAIRERQNDA